MRGGRRTDAQDDSIKRLEKRYGRIRVDGFDNIGRLRVCLTGDEPERRRLRWITASGVVERGA